MIAAILFAAAAARADVTLFPPPFAGGPLTLPGGVSVSSAQPAWQAINTGTGRGLEAYAQSGIASYAKRMGATGHTAFVDGSATVFPYNEVSDTALRVDGGLTLYPRSGPGGNVIWATLEPAEAGFFSGPAFRWVNTDGTVNELLGGANNQGAVVQGSAMQFVHFGTAIEFNWKNYAALASQTLGGGANPIPMGSASHPFGTGTFQNLVPPTDNTGNLGTGQQRWASVRAAVVTTGDLGFEDETCPVCGREFAVADDVVWRVRRKDGKVSFAVPVHVECRQPRTGAGQPRGLITDTKGRGR